MCFKYNTIANILSYKYQSPLLSLFQFALLQGPHVVVSYRS